MSKALTLRFFGYSLFGVATEALAWIANAYYFAMPWMVVVVIFGLFGVGLTIIDTLARGALAFWSIVFLGALGIESLNAYSLHFWQFNAAIASGTGSFAVILVAAVLTATGASVVRWLIRSKLLRP